MIRPLPSSGFLPRDSRTVIDLHSHILPNIDDGAGSLEVSLAMLDAYRSLGARTVFATPHLTGRLDADYRTRVDAAFCEVANRARAIGIGLERGFEIRLDPGTPAQLRSGAPVTLAGTRVALIDLPFTAWPHYADDTLFAVQTSGFIPVLAHPERYPGVQHNPDIARRLVDRGILLQVTAGSFSGIFGRSAKRSAESLLAMGLVHLVATDAHSAGHRMAAVPSGLKRLRQLVGDAGLRRLTVEAPAMLLNGDDLQPLPASSPHGGIRRLFASVGS